MHKTTLTNEVSIKQWATWLYSACKYGDYHKIKWNKLFGRLKDFGISYEFWQEWAKAKTMTVEEIREITDDYYKPEIKQDRLI